jgi:ubiquinone/menaquinone biosynthesis C-methylase UbiE
MATPDRNPQAKEMADESMVRNLAAQADAIWPQEEPIFLRHRLPAAPVILDVGCGTGEITARLGAVYPHATLIGIDVVESHLELARRRCTALGDRVRFSTGDAYDLQFPAASFDLVVCRHVLQAVPAPEQILAELVRVARPGGVLHVIAEDYDMIHAAPTRLDVARFWFEGPRAVGRATGTDLNIGRDVFTHLRRLPLDDIRVDHVVVDTLRVPRPTFAAIFEAWRDGYTEAAATHLGWSEADVRAHFDATIECIRDPDGYAVWFVPVWTARVRT